jgi:hypothetical protein
MPCHAMQCILYKIYFWKVFHMYYNLICIFICTPICTKFYSCKNWMLQVRLSKWILLGCGSVTVRLRDVIEVRTLRRYWDLSTSIPKV